MPEAAAPGLRRSAPRPARPPQATAADATIDPHPAWAAEAASLHRRANAGSLSDEHLDTLLGPAAELEDRIYVTAAGTLAGVREQVAYVRRSLVHNEPGEYEAAALDNALATLDRLLIEETTRAA